MRTLSLFVLSAALLLSAVAVSAQTPFPRDCRYEDGDYYRPGLTADITNEHGVHLYDASTGELVQSLDTAGVVSQYGTNTLYTTRLYWGRNCRYLYAINHWRTDGSEFPSRYAGLYDTVTGQRLGLWEGRDFNEFQMVFSPDRRSTFFKVKDGSYLLSDGWDAPVFLQPRSYRGTHPNLPSTESQTFRIDWDVQRRAVYIVWRAMPHDLYLYDLDTGAVRAQIGLPQERCSPPIDVLRTPAQDGHLLLYTTHQYGGSEACLGVYTLDSGAFVTLPAGERTFYEMDQIALSPSGRYLVIGMRALRVWDLQTLPADFEARQPVYRHEGPASIIGALSFVDEDTVRTRSADGVQHWNILTGEPE